MPKTLEQDIENLVANTPTPEILQEWLNDGGCEATDGCWVEPDGICEHGCQSWLLVMGLI